MDSSNIYDSVFKTMVHKAPKLLIPLINEVFGRRYEIDAPIVQFNEEHEGPRAPASPIPSSASKIWSTTWNARALTTPAWS